MKIHVRVSASIVTYRPNFFFKTVLQVDICGRKTNIFKKCPCLFGFQRSQIESQLNGADGWDLKAQWDILLIFWLGLVNFVKIITLCSQISAVSSIQRYSTWLLWSKNLGKKCGLFFEKICFSARMSSWNTSNYPYILSSCGSLASTKNHSK